MIMWPVNTVDAIAFYTVIGIFAVIVGNLIYEVYISYWIRDRNKSCLAPCCDGEE